MNNIYQKTKLAVILVLSFLVLSTFNSCDKPEPEPEPETLEQKLNGTTWEGDCDFIHPDDSDVKFKGTISISFTGKDVDIVAKFKITDTYYGYSWNETFKGTATYTYEGNNINLRLKWKNEDTDDLDDGKWAGSVNDNTMTLRNVFGETVRFSK